MKSEIPIAVIITTYNSPGYLKRALEGYLTQTELPDELIVADDGSTGETANVVEIFAGRAPFTVRYVWHEDIGFRAAKIRNEAVKMATSDYLIFSDGDCIPHPDFIADHKLLIKTGSFVQGKRMLVGKSASSEFSYGGLFNTLSLCLQKQISGCHHLVRIPGFALKTSGLRGIKTCNLALFLSDFEAVNGFDEDFVGWGREDAELTARLLNSGLSRRDPPFSALVFHLWHMENSRDQLKDNDQLLDESSKINRTFCRNGLHKGVTL